MAKKKIKKTAKKISKSTSKKLVGSKNKSFLKSIKAKNEKKQVKEIKQPITKQMLIGELASKYPKAIPLLFEAGMHCIGCGMTAYETLEQGCQAHGMSDDEIDKLVEKINKAVNKSK